MFRPTLLALAALLCASVASAQTCSVVNGVCIPRYIPMGPNGETGQVPAAGSPTDAAITQQNLTGLVDLGHRAAEPGGNGLWSVQNQCNSTEYLAFYTGTAAVTDPTTGGRLATLAIDPGTATGAQGGDQSYLQIIGPFKGPITLWGVAGCQATLPRW